MGLLYWGVIVIVGAGLAGLTCARVLHERREPFMVLEASDGAGGRVRTTVTASGFRLDRGFQVLFTAYPAVRRHLSLARLDLRRFDPGAIIALDGKLHTLADPTRDLRALPATALTDIISFEDKRQVIALRREVMRTPLRDIFVGDDTSTLEYLRARGFSERFIDNVARPLYGGIFLDRALQTSAAMFRFTFKMMAEGDVAVPAEGIGAIAEQLVRLLPLHNVRYNAPVDEVLTDGTRAYGVHTADGSVVEADAVVVAADPPTTAHLTGIPLPTTPMSTTCIYFASLRSLYGGSKIVLNAAPDAFVNTLVQITNVAPRYAPPGQHLVAATVLGLPQGCDVDIAARALEDIRRMVPRRDLSTLEPLAVIRVPFAQYAQRPGFYHALPANETGIAGLIVAGDGTLSSSIQGAMLSGRRAAEAALRAIDMGSLSPV
jgi:phytoene dehydrogenase-like protein